MIAEPELRRAASPFTTKLGQLVHLRVPCGRCGRPMPPSSAAKGYLLCPRCVGQPKPCRGCSIPIQGKVSFCEACREDVCHHCRRLGGLHLPTCPWREQKACMDCGQPMDREGRRKRLGRCAACRPNIVTSDDLAAVYVEARAKALRVARRLVGPVDAPDLVQATAMSLLNALSGLHSIHANLFVYTVRLRAMHWRRRWGRADNVPMSLEQLEILEARQEGARRGRPGRSYEVRLPEPA